MNRSVCAYRKRSGERDWHVDIDGLTIDFGREDEALRAARMLAGPGCLLVIDRRSRPQDGEPHNHIPTASD